MDDQRLDELLEDARANYRVPPEPAVEAIWEAVEAEVFATPSRRLATWRAAGMLAAASLVIGVFAGRWSAGRGMMIEATTTAGASASQVAAGPYQQTTEETLGRAAVLLAALRTTDTRGAVTDQLTTQATHLLGTTRLLIDSPAASDPRMRSLLLDLELTLAQIARLQPSRGETELTLINNAVAEHDMVPRIRSAVVDLSTGEY